MLLPKRNISVFDHAVCIASFGRCCCHALLCQIQHASPVCFLTKLLFGKLWLILSVIWLSGASLKYCSYLILLFTLQVLAWLSSFTCSRGFDMPTITTSDHTIHSRICLTLSSFMWLPIIQFKASYKRSTHLINLVRLKGLADILLS